MLKSALMIVKTEPALVTGAIQAVLALLIATGANLTAAQSGAILAVTTVALAVIAALTAARPAQVPALTGLVTTVVTLLAAFGVNHVQPGVVGTINAAIVAIMALVLRQHVTPVATLKAQASVA